MAAVDVLTDSCAHANLFYFSWFASYEQRCRANAVVRKILISVRKDTGHG